MVNIKLFFDYTKRKDGFMGRENRRYWIIIIKTGKKIRITEKQFDGIQTPKILCRAPRGEKEAPSSKRQASSFPAGTAERVKLQAPSCKRQAPS